MYYKKTLYRFVNQYTIAITFCINRLIENIIIYFDTTYNLIVFFETFFHFGDLILRNIFIENYCLDNQAKREY